MVINVRELIDRNVTPGMRRAARLFELIVYVSFIALTSGFITYWYADKQYQVERLEMRADKVAEIERLQTAYGTRLERTADKANTAVQAAEQAVSTAAEVAAKVEETANQANVAVDRASKASSQAARAAAQATSVDRVPQPTLQQINKSVEAANKQIRK